MPEVPDSAAGAAKRAPDYWLRRRAGGKKTKAIPVSAAAAAMIAQRPDAVGDLSRGLVWQEPDEDAYSGLAFVTLTPVWEKQ